MAHKTKTRLEQLTGSVGSNLADQAAAEGKIIAAGQDYTNPQAAWSLPAGIELDTINLSDGSEQPDLTGVLQQLANSIGRLSGRADWSNITPGEIKFGDESTYGANDNFDINIQYGDNTREYNNKISIQSGGQTNLRTARQLLLSSSRRVQVIAGNDNTNGLIDVWLDKGDGIRLHSSGTSGPVKIASAKSGPHALVLSASNSGGGSISSVVHPNFGSWNLFGGTDMDAGGDPTPVWQMSVQNGGPGTVVLHTSGSSGGYTHSSLEIRSGKDKNIKLSGSLTANGGPVAFALGGPLDIVNSSGPGYVALASDLADVQAWVDLFGGNQSILASIVAAEAAGGAPTIFKSDLGAVTSAGTRITVAKEAGSASGFQIDHKPNNATIYLNGQLLISASGPGGNDDNDNVDADGDYCVVGNGQTGAASAPEVKFAFQLEVGDRVTAFDLS